MSDQSKMKRQPTSWFQFWNPRSSPTRPLQRTSTASQKQPTNQKGDQPQPQEKQESQTKVTKEVPATTVPSSDSQDDQPHKATQNASTSDVSSVAQAQLPKPSLTHQRDLDQKSPASSPARLTEIRSRDADAQRAPMTQQTGQKKTANASLSSTEMEKLLSKPSDAAPRKKPVSSSPQTLPKMSKMPSQPPRMDPQTKLVSTSLIPKPPLEGTIGEQETKPRIHPSPKISLSNVPGEEQSQSYDESQRQSSSPSPPSKSSTLTDKTIDNKTTSPLPAIDNKPHEKVTNSPTTLRFLEETISSRYMNLEKSKETSTSQKDNTATNEIHESSKTGDSTNARKAIKLNHVSSGHSSIDLTKQKGIEINPNESNESLLTGENQLKSIKNSIDTSSTMPEGFSNGIQHEKPSLRQGLTHVRDTSKSSSLEKKLGSYRGNTLGAEKERTAQKEKQPQTTKPTNVEPIVPKTSKPPSPAEGIEKPFRSQVKPPIQNGLKKKDERREISADTLASPHEADQPNLHNDIKLGISRLVQNLSVGYPKQTGTEHDICIITLAGDNKGASMIIGQKMTSTEDFFPIHRSYERNPESIIIDETDGMKKLDPKMGEAKTGSEQSVTINNNTQGINNSILQNSSCSERDPGVHLNLRNKQDEPTKPDMQQERPIRYKAGDVMQAKRQTNEPTVKRRCLRALFMEPSESDPENPQKTRRHGCRFTCNEEKNKGIVDDIANP